MAGSMSDNFEKKVLDYIFRSSSMGLDASNVWIGLHTVSPTDSTTGTEVTGGSYARVAVLRNGTGFTAAAGATATTANVATITFPVATAGWGTVVAFSINDAAAAGNQMYWGSLTPVAVASADTVIFNPATLSITQD